MKESVTKFDLESAFKALDEIETPTVEKGIKANRPALTEIFSRKSKFESLFEEYYDVSSTEELGDAKEAREAEIAKAKLERIEKIVDLDAQSPEDLLTSYVGKRIMQCPQCMTLFYKDKEDIVESEDDPNTVNVGEVCQHCGNESGYTLVGKVEAEEAPKASAEEEPVEELPVEETTEETSEEPNEENLDDLDLGDLDLDLEEPTEEEKTEEAFIAHTGDVLVEEVQDDVDLDAKLKAHNEYIEYLRNTISEKEKELEKTDNEQVKAAIQRSIDALKADLEAALPDEVKNEIAAEEPVAETEEVEETTTEEGTEESVEEALDNYGNTLTEALHEEADLEVSADEFKELIDSPEFKKPISDTAVRAMLNSEKESEAENTEVKEAKSIYGCSNCGYEIEMDDEEYDGSCPNCHEHKGEFIKLDEGIFDIFKSRAQKAEWILANARKDYNEVETDEKGKLKPVSESDRLFNVFVVEYLAGKDVDGKDILVAPEPTSDKLVKGNKEAEAKSKYSDAENLAKGWSKIANNGPAMIFMAKNVTDAEKVFVCQFFKGELVQKSDKLEAQFKEIKDSIDGAKKMAKGKTGQVDTKEFTVDKLAKGMQIKFDKDKVATIEGITDGLQGGKEIALKFADGTIKTLNWPTGQKFNVITTSIGTQTESLNTIMTEVEELKESILEKLISDSLVESYGNVAGYRLTGCEYLNEKLIVNGIAYFTSGNTRKLTYTFTEAYNNEDKIEFKGLNEKLGKNKQFTLTGKIENKTLITESFKCNK